MRFLNVLLLVLFVFSAQAYAKYTKFSISGPNCDATELNLNGECESNCNVFFKVVPTTTENTFNATIYLGGATPTPSVTPSTTPNVTDTPTATPTDTPTATPNVTDTPTPTPNVTDTPTPSNTSEPVKQVSIVFAEDDCVNEIGTEAFTCSSEAQTISFEGTNYTITCIEEDSEGSGSGSSRLYFNITLLVAVFGLILAMF